MNISELWMRLEALAHLRGLPQYKGIKAQLEADLAAYQDSLNKAPETAGADHVIRRPE